MTAAINQILATLSPEALAELTKALTKGNSEEAKWKEHDDRRREMLAPAVDAMVDAFDNLFTITEVVAHHDDATGGTGEVIGSETRTVEFGVMVQHRLLSSMAYGARNGYMWSRRFAETQEFALDRMRNASLTTSNSAHGFDDMIRMEAKVRELWAEVEYFEITLHAVHKRIKQIERQMNELQIEQVHRQMTSGNYPNFDISEKAYQDFANAADTKRVERQRQERQAQSATLGYLARSQRNV